MAKTETAVRNFDDNALASWTQQGSGTPANQVKVQNGQVEITTTGNSGDYNWLQSPTTYDLTGSYVYISLVSAGSQAANFDCLPINLTADANNGIWWDINSNNMGAYKKVATVQTQVGSNLTYNSSIHKYLRIRESGGTTYWDWSTDGRAWYNFQSTANPITLTSLSILIEAGQFGAVSASTMKVDNLNYRSAIYRPTNTLRPAIFKPGSSAYGI